MDAPVLIENKCGTVRGAAEREIVTLAVQADTPQHGPVTAAFRLRGANQLLYFYTVLLNLEMQFFSLIAQRGAPSGFSALADVGEPPTVGAVSTADTAGTGSSSYQTAPAPRGVGLAQTFAANGQAPRTSRAARFEGELTSFRTPATGGRAGVEIRSTLDTHRMRYRVFFSVLHFETRAIARFDLDIGEIRALKTLAEQALAPLPRMEVLLLDDPNTVSVRLILDGPALEFALATPYGAHRLVFREAHNLATLSFWCERALAYRGNPLIAFKREELGMALWEHPDTRLPYARFSLGGPDNELMNLTRWNLGVIHLGAALALRRAVYREPEEPVPATKMENMK